MPWKEKRTIALDNGFLAMVFWGTGAAGDLGEELTKIKDNYKLRQKTNLRYRRKKQKNSLTY